MVFKKGKRGFHTGGTIRSHEGAPKPANDGNDANITVFRQGEQRQSSLNLPESFESGISYSLNKRDRWNLPVRIREQVNRLAIEDHEYEDESERGHPASKRHPITLVQHAGKNRDDEIASRNKVSRGNYVMYYGDRYLIPVERVSTKGKLSTMNMVAQLDEGKFFGGRHERRSLTPAESEPAVDDVEKQDEKSQRHRRAIRAVSKFPSQLVSYGDEGCQEVDGEHFVVYQADKKQAKQQLLRQPKKPIREPLPAPMPTKVVYSDDEGAYDSEEYEAETSEVEEVEQPDINAPARATFRLVDFIR